MKQHKDQPKNKPARKGGHNPHHSGLHGEARKIRTMQNKERRRAKRERQAEKRRAKLVANAAGA